MPRVHLLVTGQIRNVEAFDKLIKHLRMHRHAFEKAAFSTWTQEILYNPDCVSRAGDVLTMLDAGNLLPVTPLINRDIVSFIAQFRQLTCGFSYFNDDCPVLRVRADDADISSVDLTELVNAVSREWKCRQSVTTVVKGTTPNIPCFLDDRLFILSPHHISKLQSLPLASLLGLPQANLFPEFLIYSPLFLGSSQDLDMILSGEVFAFPNEISAPTGYSRRYAPDLIIRGLNDYLRIIMHHVTFFADALPSEMQKSSGFDRYITAVEREMGPSTFSGLRVAVEESIQRLRDTAESLSPQYSFVQYQKSDNQKAYLRQLAARRDYSEIIRAQALLDDTTLADAFVREQIGIALFYLGDKAKSYDFLRPLFDEGVRSFDSLFYASALAVERRELNFLYTALSEILRFHSNRRDAADHVLNCAINLDNIDQRRVLREMVMQRWGTDDFISNKAAALIEFDPWQAATITEMASPKP